MHRDKFRCGIRAPAKRYIRVIDFKRDKKNIEGKVVSLEYDPNRTCDIALIQYKDGEKRYILAPRFKTECNRCIG